MDIHGNRTSGKLTGVRSNTHEKLGLFRSQARRHGMQVPDWGREVEGDSHPSFKKITSAMSPGAKGKGARGFEWSNMQPRGKR